MVRLLCPLFLLLVESLLGPLHSSPMKLLAPLLPPPSRLPLNPSLLQFWIPRVSLRCWRPHFPHRTFVTRGSLMANGWTRLNRWGVAICPMCSTHHNLHSIPTMGMMEVWLLRCRGEWWTGNRQHTLMPNPTGMIYIELMHKGIHAVCMGVYMLVQKVLLCTLTPGTYFWASGLVHIPSVDLVIVISWVLFHPTHKSLAWDLALTLLQGPVITLVFICLCNSVIIPIFIVLECPVVK